MHNKFQYSLTFIFTSCIVACSTVHTVAPTYLFNDASKSIRVVLYDNRVIRFSQGEYAVSDNADSTFLSGTGVQYTKTNERQHKFEGRVGFREIKELQIMEPASRWETTPLITVGSLIVAFIIAFSTLHFHT